MDLDTLVIHRTKIWIRWERGGKVARSEKREEKGFWLYEVNTDRGITEDKDLQDLCVYTSVCVCVCVRIMS